MGVRQASFLKLALMLAQPSAKISENSARQIWLLSATKSQGNVISTRWLLHACADHFSRRYLCNDNIHTCMQLNASTMWSAVVHIDTFLNRTCPGCLLFHWPSLRRAQRFVRDSLILHPFLNVNGSMDRGQASGVDYTELRKQKQGALPAHIRRWEGQQNTSHGRKMQE